MRKHTPEEESRAEAALWLARLQQEEGHAAIITGLQQWLADDTRHQKAFEQTSDLWEMLGGVDPGLLEEKPGRKAFSAPIRQRLAAVVASLLVAAFFLGTGPQVRPQYFSTAVGGQRSLVLSDGSEITLNTDSAIQILYSPAERHVRLLRGEALFDVVHQASRPFAVRYRQGRLRDIGTQFVVDTATSETAVVLIEGEVAVQPDGEGKREFLLKPGERLRSGTPGLRPVIDRPPLGPLIAWKGGRAIFEDVSVAKATAEINRYAAHTHIEVASDVSGLPISGIFRTGQPYAFAAAVAAIHDLSLQEKDGVLRLAKRKTAAEPPQG